MPVKRLRGTNKKTGRCNLGISEEMNIYHAQALKDELLGYLNTYRLLQLDMSDVTEFDSAGFQLLLLLEHAARDADKQVQLHQASTAVNDVLNLYRADGLLGSNPATGEA